MNNKIYDLLVEKKAIMSGHFVLTSGLHSNRYIEKFRVLEDPESLSTICKEMASEFKNDNIDSFKLMMQTLINIFLSIPGIILFHLSVEFQRGFEGEYRKKISK